MTTQEARSSTAGSNNGGGGNSSNDGSSGGGARVAKLGSDRSERSSTVEQCWAFYFITLQRIKMALRFWGNGQ